MKNLMDDPRIQWMDQHSGKERRSIPGLISSLLHLTEKSSRLFTAPLTRFEVQNEFYSIPRFLFVGPGQGSQYIRLGIFAGIHGDEIAGSLAAVELLRQLEKNPELARGYELFVYPVCNPTGYEDNTRFSRSGTDLNREFWKNSHQAEVKVLEEQLKELSFQGIIALHADDTSDGVYGFVRGSSLTKDVLAPALEAVRGILPRNVEKIIDGFEAANGIIDKGYTGILSSPPEAEAKPFEIVLETPQHAALDKQVEAHVTAILTMLQTYRGFISYSANL